MKLLPYLLVGGGLFFLFSQNKKRSTSDLTSAAFTSRSSLQAAKATSTFEAEASAQLKDLTQELTAQVVQGFRVGEAALLPPSDRVAPFSKTNPPRAYQFAVLYSISPDLAKLVTPEELWPVYAKGIVNNPTLLKLAEETNVEAKIFNSLSLLSPQRQRMFAAKCAFRSAQLFEGGVFKGTNAKQLALDAVSTIRARADQKITAAQMEALNKPRIKQLREISIRNGKPSYAELAIDSIEKASLTSPSALSAEEKRVSHYLDMLMSVEKSRAAHGALAASVKSPPMKASPGLPSKGVTKGATEAAEAAEKAARLTERKVEIDFLEKLLRELY